jgi:hypothetical protein
MPTKKDLRNEVGAIVHAVANRALSDHTAKNIFGNVNYAKHFLQGTVLVFFDGRAPGGKNAVWKLTVDFEMLSDGAKVELKRVDIHRQHCILGAVPAGKNPHCSMTFTDSIDDPADDDIKIVLPPSPPPEKTKRKRKKATSRNDASTATPPPPTAPAAKKSKATKKKKKASKIVDLREHPVWVVPTNGKKHRAMAIT